MNVFKKTSVADEICDSMNQYFTKNASEEIVNSTKVNRAIELVAMAAAKLDRINAKLEVDRLARFIEIMGSGSDCNAKLKKEIGNEEKGLHETGTPFRRKDYKADDNHDGHDKDHELVIDEKDLKEVGSMLKDFEDE